MQEKAHSNTLVYIAGPYRTFDGWEREQNIKAAEAAMYAVAEMGLVPVCVHSMARNFDGTFTDEFWLDATMEILKRCDVVLVVGDYVDSEGTCAELAYCASNGVPFFTSALALETAVSAGVLDALP
jgi:nucleoside 2-deoxyribosyltransferase